MVPARSNLSPVLVVVLASALLTAGCISTGDQRTDATSQDPTLDETSNATAGNQAHANGTSTNQSDEEDAKAEGANETPSGSGPSKDNASRSNGDDPPPGPRTIEHARGSTTVEGRTTRVVALEFNHVENLLALGIQPVGVADKAGYERWVAAGQLAASVEDVGTRAEPSLETIAELEPDLILAVEFRHDEIYDELSRIAPTLLFDVFPTESNDTDQYDRMLDIFKRTAKATAHEEEGQARLAALEAHYDTVQAKLDELDATGREILLTQLFTYQGQPLARVFLDTSIAANVAERIGLENAWNKDQCSTGYGYCDVSKEAFVDVQHADFFYQAQPDDDPVTDEWQDDPVWNSYEFVREDRVYPLGADAWLFGGPVMSEIIADRILEHYR